MIGLKNTKLFIIIILFLFSGPVNAQNTKLPVSPQPQQVDLSRQRFVPLRSYQITGMEKPDSMDIVLLKEVIRIGSAKNTLPFEIKHVSKNNPELQRSGAYQLTLSPEKITVAAFDQRGMFYAIQTLRQLAKKNDRGEVEIPIGQITDFPDMPFRGTVEGFYGVPWSYQDRIEQLRFYGKLKLNTYIYGPKDDPYHSSPHWRDPYPAENAAQIKELVAEAKRNQVDFVWAIHPGLDIQWNRADSNAVINKFEMMYALGVRSFAVFFDDISGVGTNADKQAGLLNYILHNFVEVKKDVTPLLMCPTEYNKSWANKKEGTYLDILGEKLDSSINIMWTGNSVIADNTKEGLEWVNKRIRRPAFVWWNFPVSDYVRDHLLMGPAYGLDKNVATDMSGFVSNPMDKAEASKIAIFSVALYTWNMKSYQPQEAWLGAIKYIMPEAAEAFELFASHNSDPGPNGHGYRREESVQIKPVIDSFWNAYKTGAYLKADAQKIQTEFNLMLPVAKEIRSKSKNERLVEQLSPWLSQFELLAKSGIHAMQMAEAWNRNNYETAWYDYLKVGSTLDSMALLDKSLNQNPYQPGVKTGSLVLTPFVKEMYEHTGDSFENLGKTEGNSKIKNESSSGILFTNAEKLMNQPLRISNQEIAISPLLEVVTLKENEFVGFHVDSNLRITAMHFNLQSNNLLSWGHFEVSTDGQNWKAIDVLEKNGKGDFSSFDEGVHSVRFRNTSGKPQSFFLKEWRLEVKPANSGDQSLYAFDGSVNTWQKFSKEEPVNIKLPMVFKNVPHVFLLKSNGAIFTIYALNKKGKKSVLYKGNRDYVTINKIDTKRIKEIQFVTEAEQPVLIYEIVASRSL